MLRYTEYGHQQYFERTPYMLGTGVVVIFNFTKNHGNNTTQYATRCSFEKRVFRGAYASKHESPSPGDATCTVSRLTVSRPPITARATQELASPTPLPAERRSLISIPPRDIVHHVVESTPLIEVKEGSIILLVIYIFPPP